LLRKEQNVQVCDATEARYIDIDGVQKY